MTDQPGPPPEPTSDGEQLVPVPPPPSEVAPADRFTSPPPVRATEGLTPERGAAIIRQSAAARWVGFLTVLFTALFIVFYWFWELGGPLGILDPRLEAQANAQQVTTVERGYNVYQANCARCHGPNGLGPLEPDADEVAYIGPILNSQEKLFAHLNEDYLNTVLTAGGRYVCGNATSAMPVWSDQATPPGPLNYRQIEEVIAFIRAPKTETFLVKDPELNEPVIDPETGEEETFQGWVDPDYEPAPGATPYPACYLDALGGGGGSPGPSASIDPDAPKVLIIATNATQFDTPEVETAADTPFTVVFQNDDPANPHNVVISDPEGELVPMGDTSFFVGVETREYPVGALSAGEYPFICQVHPTTMTGTLTVR